MEKGSNLGGKGQQCHHDEDIENPRTLGEQGLEVINTLSREEQSIQATSLLKELPRAKFLSPFGRS